MAEQGLARLVSWTVENFMSIKHATCEFDERNIINLKGYNDSGKSAMLRALDVLFYNLRPNAQVNFINDEADYFRIVARFSDGITIMRDKYRNGQSLYEMYNKDNECIYTTKVNGVLSRVSEVPDPIQKYFNLLEYEGTLVNSRTCFEKQLLVQTSGGDNYKLLNSVLKSEELASASALLNEDKNKISTEMNQIESSITTYKDMLTQTEGLTEEIVVGVESLDKSINTKEQQAGMIKALVQIRNTNNAMSVPQELPSIDEKPLQSLTQIQTAKNTLNSLSVPPEVKIINVDGYKAIKTISDTKKRISEMGDGVLLPQIDSKGYDSLSKLATIKKTLTESVAHLSEIEQSIEEVKVQLTQCKEEAGGAFVQCPNCGELVAVES